LVARLLKSIGIRFAVFDVGQVVGGFFPSHAFSRFALFQNSSNDELGTHWRARLLI
jgi:hypothetical protein